MEQNSNLFINVINNISVTTTIIYSVIIIACSVEIPLVLNKIGSLAVNYFRTKKRHMKMIITFIEQFLMN